MRRTVRFAAALAMSLVFAGACLGAEGRTVIIATDNGFDSQKFHNAIAEIIVERAFDGYEFDVSTASSTMNWQSIIAGDVDLDIDSWTDNVASYPDDVARGDIVDVGVLVPNSAQGVYVPRYVVEGDASRGIEPVAPGLDRVEDLAKYHAAFPDEEDPSKGRFYGSIPGWMADEILYKKFVFYGLDKDFNYVRLGSEASLFASLVAAYNLGVPWVGYCYEPTWVAGRLDLIRLADAPYEQSLYLEGKSEFPEQEVKIVSSAKFAAKAPDLLEFFKKYRTGSELVSKALAHLDETKSSYEDTAVWFMKENDSLIDEWLPAENAARLRAYLSSL
jgi:glycine betaine/proline transport system permease protein/glycine betaine/proline transport system substrate-binding protein